MNPLPDIGVTPRGAKVYTRYVPIGQGPPAIEPERPDGTSEDEEGT